MKPIIWSYGGGTQSVAMAILVYQGKLPRPERVVMADTGREKSITWNYTAQYVRPLLAEIGLEIELASHELATVDLYGKNGDLLIPAYTEKGKLPTFCSNEWKQRVVRRYLRALGYGPRNPIVVWLGMSLDELGRMKPAGTQWVEHAWPLIMDLHINRAQCKQTVEAFGWPTPPKSACFMCPFTTNTEWQRLKLNEPGDWTKAVALDIAIREHDTTHNVFVHSSGKPLAEADLSVPDKPILPMFGEMEDCDSGYCMV